jgi:hypothetical protein
LFKIDIMLLDHIAKSYILIFCCKVINSLHVHHVLIIFSIGSEGDFELSCDRSIRACMGPTQSQKCGSSAKVFKKCRQTERTTL